MNPNKAIGIMLVEDQAILRETMAHMLQDEKSLEVMGLASDGKELLSLLERECPDIVITDLEMPGMGGKELTIVLKKKFPNIKVIVLSQYTESYYISNLIMVGARAYLTKKCSINELVHTINKVHDVGYYFDQNVSQLVVGDIMKASEYKPELHSLALSARETEVLKLICNEKTNKQIADKMNLSIKTVDYHRQQIYKKTNLRSSVGLVKYAIKNGVLPLGFH